MLDWFNRRTETGRRASELYGAVVAAARQPIFYERFGVTDTPEGRYELIALHLFLALEGIQDRSGDAERELVRRVIESFVTDIDDCMREMGVGDLSVGKKVKRAAAGFYERASAYRTGLADTSPLGLGEVLRHNMRVDATGHPIAAGALALYIRSASTFIRTQSIADFVASGDQDRLLAELAAEVK